MSVKPNCEKCRFAEIAIIEDVDEGTVPGMLCRRYPPQMVFAGDDAGGGSSTMFPAVVAGEWCGEFQWNGES